MPTVSLGSFVSGSTLEFTFTLKTDGVADNLTTAQSVKARVTFKGSEKLAAKNLVAVTPASGVMRLDIEAEESVDWFDGVYAGDVAAVLANGDVRHYDRFEFTLRRAITP